MKKHYLGIVCILYSLTIIYVVITDKLKNFLAINMQIYIKLSIIPLFFIGLVLCFNNKIKYKFKISDLLLLLPIFMLLLTSDGKLTSNFATNRVSNFGRKNNNVIEPIDIKEEIEVPTEEVSKEEFIPDYIVIDEVYNELANYITYPVNYKAIIGKKIRVSGLSLRTNYYLPDNYAMIGKYSITCCAADSEFIGFILDYDKSLIKNNTWYEVEGILTPGKDKQGYDIMLIKVVNIKEIDETKEEQYIYPCNMYGDGSCSEVLKYNLEY